MKIINVKSLTNKINCRNNNSLLLKNVNYLSNPQIAFKADTFRISNEDKQEFTNSIGGYHKEKYAFYEKYIEPIVCNQTSNFISPAVLLYSIDSSVIENFNKEILCTALKNNINFKKLEYNNNEEFQRNLNIELEKNKNYYLNNKKRSILVINHPELISGMNLDEAKSYTNLDYNPEEVDVLMPNKGNAQNVRLLKSLLDYSHLLPEENGFATTILFNSQNPHLIHPHLRDGKLSKFYIKLAQNDELMQLLNEQLDVAKYLTSAAVQKSFEDGNITAEAAQLNFNKLGNLQINDNIIALSVFNLFVSPHVLIGGYSKDLIEKLLYRAVIKNLEHPNIPFLLIFSDIVSKTKRDISSFDLHKDEKIKNILNKELDDYEKLIGQYNDGLLNDSEIQKIEQIIHQEKELLCRLKVKYANGLLTPDEIPLLEKYINRYER